MKGADMSRRAAGLSVCWLILASGALQAQTLAARVGAVIDGPDYKHGRWGLLLVEQDTGRVVFERNPDQLFAPASTTKLYTCSAALHYLGQDYRFETPVYRRGSVENGVLRGDLILVASGDLTLGGRTLPDGTMAFADNDHTYADATSTTAAVTPTDPLAGLKDLARQVKESGIRRVEGEVLIDARLFEPSRSSGSGPDRVSPVMVNDNVVDVLVTPATDAGQPATIKLRPETALVQSDAQVQTVASGKPFVEVTGAGPGRIVVRGHVAVNSPPLVRIHPVEEPAAFERGLLIETLRREGVAVRASPLREPRAELPERAAYSQLPRAALFTSPPLSEAVKVTLKVSHNLYASTLPLLVAAKHRQRTAAQGLRSEGRFLRELGVDGDSASFGGGAGGERADATTPRATVQLLQAMMKRPEYPALEDGLPILGVDGTLANAVASDSPARGKVRAKTGTLWYSDLVNDRGLLRSKALAGTMTTAGGKKLVFAMFVNDVPLPPEVTPSREGRVLGKLCELVFQYAE
jgi:D-alanyl-D-alanine carboxypeptidase/D-alanyl-D-alanine-endopeptidase (penicillin-binding protein 4)